MTWLWFDVWMTKPVGVEVSESDRAILQRRVAASTTKRRDWQRAKIVLMAADATSSPSIAREVGVNRNQVDVWKHRYRAEGLNGLRDRDRSGRPAVYGPEDRLTLVKTITTRPPEDGQLSPKRRKARMSMPEVARRLRDDHDIPISESQVWRICRSMKIKPWQVRSWMTSHDPDFDAKAVDVCGLYLDPQENWAVFSVDEKTGMQAKSRINPTQPAGVDGEAARQEFEYKRHGTKALFAAFECGTGEVIVRPSDSTKSVNFVSFLAELDAQVPAHLELHCIVDNLAAHGTPGVEEFLDQHHRVFLHRTPTHASWLNQIEMWFSILTRQLLDTAEFADTSDLAGAILDYVTDYNTRAKPFNWTWNAKPPSPDSHDTSARDH
jgi:transposase